MCRIWVLCVTEYHTTVILHMYKGRPAYAESQARPMT